MCADLPLETTEPTKPLALKSCESTAPLVSSDDSSSINNNCSGTGGGGDLSSGVLGSVKAGMGFQPVSIDSRNDDITTEGAQTLYSRGLLSTSKDNGLIFVGSSG